MKTPALNLGERVTSAVTYSPMHSSLANTLPRTHYIYNGDRLPSFCNGGGDGNDVGDGGYASGYIVPYHTYRTAAGKENSGVDGLKKKRTKKK